MMHKLTLYRKMILGGIIAVLVPLLVFGAVIASKLTGSLLDIFDKEAIINANNMAKIITVTLEREMDYASALAVDNNLIELMSQKKYAAAMECLKTAHKRIKADSLGLLIIDPDGFLRADISNDSMHLDVSDRAYFLQAKSGSIGIQGPIIARRDKRWELMVVPSPVYPLYKELMVVASPVYKENAFVGVLAVALDIRYLIAMTSSIRSGKTGYAYVTDNEGFAVIHPRKELVLKENLFRLEGMQNFAEKLKNTGTGSAAYTYKGVKKLAGYTHVELTDWNVIYCQDRDEIMMPIKAINNFLLLSGCLFLVLVIVIIVILSPKISVPAQKSIDLLQKLIEHSDYAILTMGVDGSITNANPAAEKIFNKNSKDLVGTQPVLENAGNTPVETIWSELKSGRIWTGNISIKPAASDALTLAVMIIPVEDTSGNIESFLEVARDITEELRIQSRLAQSQKMESLGTIAGGIAHDFNNILSAIFAYTEFSLEVPGNPPETQKNLNSLLTAAERARDLVSQILTFSRKTAQELRPLTPKLIVKEAAKMLRSTIPAEIELKTSIVSDAMVMADPVQIHQIVVNICTNAVHAIKPNSGNIEIVLEDMVVDEMFAHSHPGIKPGNHILLKISDSGKGMEKEILDRIFEPFFTTKPAGEGTGMGLSVVHGLVKKLGGIITVYSRVGEGTAFNIIIPAIAKTYQENGSPETVCVGGTERILLIDDEQSIAEPIAIILTNLGYHVSVFTDSTKALDTFRQNPDAFDLVITDYSMPQLTGYEIAHTIRELKNDIRIIVNSGYITQEIHERFANVGVNSILKKPINKFQLAEAIRKALT
jgi:PAS domain S-box-containing protein